MTAFATNFRGPCIHPINRIALIAKHKKDPNNLFGICMNCQVFLLFRAGVYFNKTATPTHFLQLEENLICQWMHNMEPIFDHNAVEIWERAVHANRG